MGIEAQMNMKGRTFASMPHTCYSAMGPRLRRRTCLYGEAAEHEHRADVAMPFLFFIPFFPPLATFH